MLGCINKLVEEEFQAETRKNYMYNLYLMNVCINREGIKYVKIDHRISVETRNYSHKEIFAEYDNFSRWIIHK